MPVLAASPIAVMYAGDAQRIALAVLMIVEGEVQRDLMDYKLSFYPCAVV